MNKLENRNISMTTHPKMLNHWQRLLAMCLEYIWSLYEKLTYVRYVLNCTSIHIPYLYTWIINIYSLEQKHYTCIAFKDEIIRIIFSICSLTTPKEVIIEVTFGDSSFFATTTLASLFLAIFLLFLQHFL